MSAIVNEKDLSIYVDNNSLQFHLLAVSVKIGFLHQICTETFVVYNQKRICLTNHKMM